MVRFLITTETFCHSRLHLVELSEARGEGVVDGRELVRDLVAEDEALVSGVRVGHSLEGQKVSEAGGIEPGS